MAADRSSLSGRLIRLLPAVIPGISNGRVPQPGFPSGYQSTAGSVISLLFSRTMTHIIYPLLGALAILFIIYAGIQYITSAGNPEKVKRARQNLVNVIVGVILLLLVYTILGLYLGFVRSIASSV